MEYIIKQEDLLWILEEAVKARPINEADTKSLARAFEQMLAGRSMLKAVCPL